MKMTKYMRYRNNLIEQGLCPQCGQPKDREGYYCTECLKKQNERRKEDVAFFISIGVCRICGKNPQYPGSTYCEFCLERVNADTKKRYLENPEYFKEKSRISNKKRYDECKAQGICTRCRKRKAESGKVKCRICLDKDALRHKYNKSTPITKCG